MRPVDARGAEESGLRWTVKRGGGKARYIDFQWRNFDCGGDPKRVRDIASVVKIIEIQLMFYCIHSCHAKHLVRVQAV